MCYFLWGFLNLVPVSNLGYSPNYYYSRSYLLPALWLYMLTSLSVTCLLNSSQFQPQLRSWSHHIFGRKCLPEVWTVDCNIQRSHVGSQSPSHLPVSYYLDAHLTEIPFERHLVFYTLLTPGHVLI